MEKLLIAPVIPFGVATHHINFPGTIDLGLETMIKVMGAVFESLYRHGARRFAVINGHGGNDPAIEKAALEMYRTAQILRCKFQPYLKQSNREKLQRNESMNLFYAY